MTPGKLSFITTQSLSFVLQPAACSLMDAKPCQEAGSIRSLELATNLPERLGRTNLYERIKKTMLRYWTPDHLPPTLSVAMFRSCSPTRIHNILSTSVVPRTLFGMALSPPRSAENMDLCHWKWHGASGVKISLRSRLLETKNGDILYQLGLQLQRLAHSLRNVLGANLSFSRKSSRKSKSKKG